MKTQTEVRGERPLNFPEVRSLLLMKPSGIGCQDFSHPAAQRRSSGARHGAGCAASRPGAQAGWAPRPRTV